MTHVPGYIIADVAAALGTWPAFGALILLSALFFGYLVPKAKAPVFARVTTMLPHKLLDEYFWSWTPDIAEHFLTDIGPEGRAAYRRFYWIMDFWFPGALGSLTLASLLLLAFPPGSGFAWVYVFAAPSWIFDIAENVTHFRMAGSYPRLSPASLTIGPSFTRLKWVFALAPLPIAIAGFVAQFFR